MMAPIIPSKNTIPTSVKENLPLSGRQNSGNRKANPSANKSEFEQLKFRSAEKSSIVRSTEKNPVQQINSASVDPVEKSGSRNFTLQTLSAFAGMISEAFQPQEISRPGAPVNDHQKVHEQTAQAQPAESSEKESEVQSRPLRPGSTLDFSV